MVSRTVCTLLAMLALAPQAGLAQENRRPVHQPDFFPFAVWYSGGKARAPVLSELTPASRTEWRRDLQQIRDLGFNTVRTWGHDPVSAAPPARRAVQLRGRRARGWSVEESVRRLLRLHWAEKRLMEVAHAHLPATPEWEVKCALMAAFLAERQDRPWGRYRDYARQLWDEARHAQMGSVGLHARGVDWTQLPCTSASRCASTATPKRATARSCCTRSSRA